MFLTEHWLTVMGKTLIYVDALSVLAVVLIILFLLYISIRQKKNNKK
ncbi:MAG: hypothetical protein IJ389_02745 [Clostridia bacterium]|nr:hypothetical protein [Clostridia bacterium]